MSITFELDAKSRTDIGKGASRRLRHADLVPAVIYGGKSEPQSITLNHHKFWNALSHEAFASHILTISVDGKKQKAVLKDVQRHPYKARVQHADFLRVSASEKIVMHVPLHFIGEEDAPGIKSGGVLNKHSTELEIRCLPKDLPEFIEVNCAALELDQVVHLSDLKIADGVELMAHVHNPENDPAIVSVHEPKVQEEPEEVAADAEAAEGDAEGAADAQASDDAPAEESSEDKKED